MPAEIAEIAAPGERSAPVAGVVLAAGSSSRMGTNKLLLDLGTETVVRRAVRQALGAGLSPVIAVLGFEAERVAAALAGLEVDLVVNAGFEQGINTSVQLGMARVPADRAAAVVLLADMPLVTSGMLAALVERYRAGGAPLVLSLYGDVQAPPTLYDRALFPEFVGLAGEGCGRQIVRKHRDRATAVAQPAAALQDLDRPDDVEPLRSRLIEDSLPQEFRLADPPS